MRLLASSLVSFSLCYHGVVVIFVIKLKDFNKVVETTMFTGIHPWRAYSFPSLPVLQPQQWSSGLGSSCRTNEVTSVEGTNLTISLEVVDIKSKFDWSISFFFRPSS